jgi:hypothetical protein
MFSLVAKCLNWMKLRSDTKRTGAMSAALAVLLCAITGSRAQAIKAPTQNVNLCEVMRSPKTYSGHSIVVRGVVMGENTDHLLIIWPECQFGMRLVISSDVEAHADVQSLYRAVKQGNPGTTDRDITREFTGLFRYSEVGSLYELVVETIRPTAKYSYPN